MLTLNTFNKSTQNFWKKGFKICFHSSSCLNKVRPGALKLPKKQIKGKLNKKFFIPRHVSEKIRGDLHPSIPHDLFQNNSSCVEEIFHGKPIDREIALLSNDELCNLIKVEQGSKKIRENFKDIENESIKRIFNSSVTDIIKFLDALFLSRMDHRKFVDNVCKFLINEWTKLNFEIKDILHLLFYISNYRSVPITLMNNFEEFIRKNSVKISGNEYGLICHSFFVTNTSFRNYETIKEISTALIKDFNSIDGHHIGNILKCLRHSGYNQVDMYDKLCAKLLLSSFIDKEPLTNLTHIAHAFASAKISNKELFDKLLERTLNILRDPVENEHVRTKDVIKVLWSSSILQHPISVSLLNHLTKILIERHDRDNFPEAFVDGVLSLCMNNYINSKLIGIALKLCKENSKKGRIIEMYHQYMILNDFCLSKGSSYGKFLISPEWFMKHSRRENPNLISELERRQGLATIWCTLNRLLGGTLYAKCGYILQSTKIADITIAMDRNGNFVPVPSSLSNNFLEGGKKQRRQMNQTDYFEMAKKADKKQFSDLNQCRNITEELISFQDNLKHSIENRFYRSSNRNPALNHTIAIKVLGWNQCLRNFAEILGLHRLEVRILNQLGIHVLLMNPKEMMTISGLNDRDKDNYCKENILKILRNELISSG